ncbi:MAG: calcium-binding protein [Thermoguttaceae bacterium]|jgi:hypothetical protein
MCSPDRARQEDPYERQIRHPEDRLRAILGLGRDDLLPEVNDETIRKYYQYLALRLTLPFEARYSAESEPVVYPVTVTGLVDPQSAPAGSAVCCVTHVRNGVAVLPLVDIEVPEDSPNFRILEDYWYWVWNWRAARADFLPFRSR